MCLTCFWISFFFSRCSSGLSLHSSSIVCGFLLSHVNLIECRLECTRGDAEKERWFVMWQYFVCGVNVGGRSCTFDVACMYRLCHNRNSTMALINGRSVKIVNGIAVVWRVYHHSFIRHLSFIALLTLVRHLSVGAVVVAWPAVTFMSLSLPFRHKRYLFSVFGAFRYSLSFQFWVFRRFGAFFFHLSFLFHPTDAHINNKMY